MSDARSQVQRCGESGATSVEYAILASLIAAVIVTTVVALGLQLPPIFQSVIDGWL